jgi:AcrR family transcriptional regulator
MVAADAVTAAEESRGVSTKQRLIDGAIEAIRVHGIAGVSARTVAATAGVNQALVFYHFGTVDELLAAACAAATAERVATYRERFAAVGSLRELLDVGRALHQEESRLGNVAVLAQLLAGAQTDPRLAAPVRAAVRQWSDEIEPVLHRLLDDSPLAEIADPAGLAPAVAAGFIGLELYEGVDPEGADAALAALQRLAVLVDVVEELGPVARAALRRRTRRARTRPARAEK